MRSGGCGRSSGGTGVSDSVVKSEVRARFRAEVPSAVDGVASDSISARLLQLAEVEKAACVLGYLAIRGEPCMDRFLEQLRCTGVRVCVPMVDWAGGGMEPGEFEGLDRLVCVRHGVREPADGRRIVPIEELRVVLVPGVAFDMRGARLGRGGGFYDRFLARLNPGTARIGVCFERRVVESLPIDPWDQKVDVLVTENAVRRLARR